MGGRGSGSGKGVNATYREGSSGMELDSLNYDLTDDDWVQRMTDAESSALYEYTSDLYDIVNPALRKGDLSKLTTEEKEQIDLISAGIKKYKLKENVIAYRGGSLKMFGNNLTVDNMNDWIGGKLQDNGFMSTSISANTGKSFSSTVLFKIKAPKGSNAAYVVNNSNYSGEYELLFDKGTKMKITDIKYKNGTFHVETTIIK